MSRRAHVELRRKAGPISRAVRAPASMSVPVERWLAKADGDLRAARLLRADDDVLPSIVGFHAQQAIEKYLKAVLVAGGIRPPREHSISRLWASMEALPRVAHLPVTRFAVLERYPRLDNATSTEPSVMEVDEAIAYAEDVRNLVVDFLNGRG